MKEASEHLKTILQMRAVVAIRNMIAAYCPTPEGMYLSVSGLEIDTDKCTFTGSFEYREPTSLNDEDDDYDPR